MVLSIISVLMVALGISAANILEPQTAVFVSLDNYIRLLLADKTMHNALLNTYLPGIICSVVCVGLFSIICKIASKKRKVSKAFYRIGSVLIAAVVAFFTAILIKVNLIGLYPAGYPAHTIVMHAPPSVWETLTVFDIITPLQTGVFVAFLFWLAETIVGIINNKKQKL